MYQANLWPICTCFLLNSPRDITPAVFLFVYICSWLVSTLAECSLTCCSQYECMHLSSRVIQKTKWNFIVFNLQCINVYPRIWTTWNKFKGSFVTCVGGWTAKIAGFLIFIRFLLLESKLVSLMILLKNCFFSNTLKNNYYGQYYQFSKCTIKLLFSLNIGITFILNTGATIFIQVIIFVGNDSNYQIRKE